MKKRKGSSLVMTILVCFLLVVFGVIITTYTTNNALTARLQRQRYQAYYLVLSGIELGTNAVMQSEAGIDYKLLNDYKADPTKAELKFTVSADELIAPDNWDYDGEITIIIRATDKEGNPATASTADVWVEISSKGRVRNDDGTVDTQYAGKQRINTDNPSTIIREVANPNDFI